MIFFLILLCIFCGSSGLALARAIELRSDFQDLLLVIRNIAVNGRKTMHCDVLSLPAVGRPVEVRPSKCEFAYLFNEFQNIHIVPTAIRVNLTFNTIVYQ